DGQRRRASAPLAADERGVACLRSVPEEDRPRDSRGRLSPSVAARTYEGPRSAPVELRLLVQVPRCLNCGAENPATQKFCGECGAALLAVCESCGTRNPPGQKFCGECGSPLPAIAATGARAAQPTVAVAERRLVSVLFADLVGFTPL